MMARTESRPVPGSTTSPGWTPGLVLEADAHPFVHRASVLGGGSGDTRGRRREQGEQDARRVSNRVIEIWA